ncbi:unnamed protein product, partial [Polarella glacialis]
VFQPAYRSRGDSSPTRVWKSGRARREAEQQEGQGQLQPLHSSRSSERLDVFADNGPRPTRTAEATGYLKAAPAMPRPAGPRCGTTSPRPLLRHRREELEDPVEPEEEWAEVDEDDDDDDWEECAHSEDQIQALQRRSRAEASSGPQLRLTAQMPISQLSQRTLKLLAQVLPDVSIELCAPVGGAEFARKVSSRRDIASTPTPSRTPRHSIAESFRESAGRCSPEEATSLPLPPSAESWDWPLSRLEKKSRIVMLDRHMLLADKRELADEVRQLRRSSRAGSQPPSRRSG